VEQDYGKTLEDTVQKRPRSWPMPSRCSGSVSNEMILRAHQGGESRDEDTGGHVARVGLYCRVIAEEIGMPADFVESIPFSSAMHDIGKIGIPDSITSESRYTHPGRRDPYAVTHHNRARILANSTYPKIQMSASIALLSS